MLGACTDQVRPLPGVPRLSCGSIGVQNMTLTRFVTKNAFRNKRRSILTVLSIGFSLLLLTFMITIWRGFYVSKGSAESMRPAGDAAPRVAYFQSYRASIAIKSAPCPEWWRSFPFRGLAELYKDHKPENFFAQFGTDPDEFLEGLPGDADAAGSACRLATRPRTARL